MKRRVLSWLMVIAMTAGSLSFSVPSYAVSDEAIYQESLETEAEAGGSEATDDAVLTDVETTDDAASATVDDFEAELSDESASQESYVFTIENAKIEAGLFEELSEEEAGVKLDELLKPTLSVDGVLLQNGGADEFSFTTSYKFVIIPKSEDITEDDDEYLSALVLPASDKDFKLIEGKELSEIPAGSRVLVYAGALSAQGKEYFTANVVYIVEPKATEAEGNEEDAASEDESALVSDVQAEENGAASEEVTDEEVVEEVPEETVEEEALVEGEGAEAAEAAEVPEETADDDELVAAAPSINDNTIGFIGNSVAFNTVKELAGCKAELYAYSQDNKKDLTLIGTTILGDIDNFADINHFLNSEDIRISLKKEAFKPAEYTLFARFYPDSTNPKKYKESSNAIKLTVSEAPQIVEVVPSDKSSSNGSVIIAENSKYSKAVIGKYLSDEELKTVSADSEGKFTFANLAAGNYTVSYLPDGTIEMFADSLNMGSAWTEVYVPVKSTLKSLTVYGKYGNDVSDAPIVMPAGATQQLYAELDPVDFDGAVIWKLVEGEDVVKIDNGLVTGVKEGNATISVSVEGVADSERKVTVVVDGVVNKPYSAKTFKADKTKITLKHNVPTTVTFTGDKKLNELDAGIDYISSNDVASLYSTGDTFNEEGKTREIPLVGNKAGQCIITATLNSWSNVTPVKEKSVSITVNVNGYNADQKTAYKDGKILTGFVNVDSDKNLLSSGKIDVDMSVDTYYIDPATKKSVSGISKAGKKLYYFRDDGRLVKNTENKVIMDNDPLICMNKDGELNTGWVTPINGNGEYYFDPVTGAMAKNAWVPRGKGYVYVNEEGLYIGDSGFVTFGSDDYYIKDGVRQTGFVYLDADYGYLSSSKNAKYAYYYDPKNGGKKAQSGFFVVKGKIYYAYPKSDVEGAPLPGTIVLNNVFAVNDKKYCSDKNGVVMTNKFMTYDGKTYYAGADGILYSDVPYVIGGKTYIFSTQGVVESFEEATEIKDLYYKTEKGVFTPYYRNTNIKKPQGGVSFYTDATCKTMLKNTAIYEDEECINICMYIGKNGSPVTGPQKIGSDVYYFGPTGDIEGKTGYAILKGKTYYVKNGKVVNTPGFYVNDQGKYFYVKDSSGVIATGVTTIGKKKYIFDAAGNMIIPDSDHIVRTENNRYYCNRGGAPKTAEDLAEYYIVTGKVQRVSDSEIKVVGKDGTPYTGFFTESGKKYLVIDGELDEAANTYVVYGGKGYYFGSDGYAVGGWRRCYQGVDFDAFEELFDSSDGYYFYFDEKSLNVVTGWKTMLAPATDGRGNIVTDRSGNVVLSMTSKKLYFNETATPFFPKGALVRNCDMTIKGKTYRFGPDGSIQTGAAGRVVSEVRNTGSVSLESYRKADGTLATGRTEVTVDGQKVYYYFSPVTRKAEKNVIRKTGNKWYYYGSNGRMSLSFQGYSDGRGPVIGVFNKDGSISGFKYMYEGIAVKNALIHTNKDAASLATYYVIGSKGLPEVGLCDIPGNTEKVDDDAVKIYVESDGDTGFGLSSPYCLEKIGKKIYLVKDGQVVVRNSLDKAIGISDISMPDTLTQEELDKLMKYYYLTDSSEGMQLKFVTQSDGSLGKGTFTDGGVTYHTNQLGIVIDLISPFIKEGGKWKMSAMAKRMPGNGYCMDGKMIDVTSLEEHRVRVSYDSNCFITSITYLENGYDTGVPVDGVMMMGEGIFINISKGKIVTVKKKVFIEGYTITLEFDPDIALAYVKGFE